MSILSNSATILSQVLVSSGHLGLPSTGSNYFVDLAFETPKNHLMDCSNGFTTLLFEFSLKTGRASTAQISLWKSLLKEAQCSMQFSNVMNTNYLHALSGKS